MSLLSRDKGEPVGYENKPVKRVELPTKEELNTKSLEWLLRFRAEFEEKLDYMRKNNAPDNEILLENEKYHQMLERVIKDKISKQGNE